MVIGGRAHSVDEINHVGEAGLSFAEINVPPPLDAFQEIPALLNLKEKYNLSYLVHGPEEGNPFDCQELRVKLLPQIELLVAFAHELKATLITVHFWLDQRFIDKTILTDKLAVLEKMVLLATEKRISLCLENLSERSDDFKPVFSRFPHLGLTLDIGHGELLTSKNTVYSLIESYPERIRHVHIHDNYGGDTPADDLHLPLGKGTIVFEPILQSLHNAGYDGTITLEVAPEFLREGKEKLTAMLAACAFPQSAAP